MNGLTTSELKSFSRVQMAAEALYAFDARRNSLLVPGDISNAAILKADMLMAGNGHASKFTETDATQFVSEWTLVEHISNTKSGFSGTIFQNKDTKEFVLSCRSTEFIDDAVRDCQATNKLEIQDKGWSFGQLSDLEDWYQSSVKKLVKGGTLNVTGYSLGGHLATAFNLMHESELNKGKVVTFNGAGVGQIGGADITDGRKLQEMLACFKKYMNNESNCTAGLMQSDTGLKKYSIIKEKLTALRSKDSGNGDIADTDIDKMLTDYCPVFMDYCAGFVDGNVLNALANTNLVGGITSKFISFAKDKYPSLLEGDVRDQLLLGEALLRVRSIVHENDRVTELKSGDATDPLNTKPAIVHDGQIAAEDLDYQLAVLQSSKQFNANGVNTNPLNPLNTLPIFFDKTEVDKTIKKKNQYDVVARPYDGNMDASLVSHSQMHYGTDTGVFVEDQPYFRGNVLANVAQASAEHLDLKLLVNDYVHNDFGDTHSLALIVDSLSVQNLLSKLDLSLTPESCAKLLQAVSNKKADTSAIKLGQGTCEGDALENMVSYVAKITGCNIEKMNPSCDGNTWSEINSRELLHKNIETLNAYLKDLMGKVKISIADKDVVTSSVNNFGALLSLVNVSPIVLSGADSAGQSFLNKQLGSKWPDLYAQWQADATLTQEQRDQGKSNFSEAYLQDRSKLLGFVVEANSNNYVVDVASNSTTIKINRLGVHEQWLFNDALTGMNTTIQIDGAYSQSYVAHEISFGGTGNDTLHGERQYGGDGDDILVGAPKTGFFDAYFEGGKGNDTYQLVSGGLATILDSDGRGVIQINGQVVKGAFLGSVQNDEVYYSQDNPYQYRLSKGLAGEWALAIRDSATSLHYTTVAKLQAWQSGEFGITTQQSNQARVALEFPKASVFIAIDASDAPESGVQLVGSPNVDSIKGSWYSDIIKTGEGNSFVLGNGGSDYIEGGSGKDYIFAGPGIDPSSTPDSDVVYAGAGTDIVIGGGGDDVLWGDKNDGGYLNDTAESNSKGDWLSAGRGDDLVYGSSGQDVLLGGADGDTIQGGAGNDLIMGDASGSPQLAIGTVSSFSQAPVVIPGMGGLPGGVVQPSASTGLLSYEWKSGAFALADSVYSPLIVAKGSMFEWQWSVAADGALNIANESTILTTRVEIRAGDDVLDGGNGDDWVAGQAGNDTLYGGEGDDILYGDDAIALAWGVDGNDKIHAGAGKDKLFGGGGNDILWATEDDKVVDSLQGGEGNDSLFGGTGADQLDGGAGDDDLHAGNDGSSLVGGEGADLLMGGAGNDKLDGGAGSDYFVTSAGADSLIDAEGNDYYQINSKEFVAASAKTVISDGDGKGLLHLDNEVIEGKALTATSKSTWKANSGAYTLELKAGSLFISMKDAAGSVEIKNVANAKAGYLGLVLPEYKDQPDPQVNHAPVLATPLPNKSANEDKAFKFVLPTGTFTDSDAGDSVSLSATLTNGKALPAWLTFDAKSRTFSGTPGNDNVGALSIKVTATDKAGAAVSDAFKLTVKNVNDAPVVATPLLDQSGKEGAAFRYVLAADAFRDVDVGDKLTYSALLADGKALPSWLTFDAATRTLSGTPVSGAAGDLDIQVNATDSAGARVSDRFLLKIASAVKVINGTAGADKLTGTAGVDQINGLAGNDTLDGGAGADILSGGAGHDVYRVDNIQDSVIENAGEGTDRVLSSVTYALADNVENLTLTGSAAINGTGNGLNNTLVGNSKNNTLTGAQGKDKLDGGAGNDTLNGGAGNDTYLFGRGEGSDLLIDNDSTAGNRDLLLFKSGIAADQLWFSKSGNDLQLTVIGSSDGVKVQNWYSGNPYHVEQFKTTDGKTLLDSQVANLVNAMATLTPPAAGQTSLSAEYHSKLDVVLAANWK